MTPGDRSSSTWSAGRLGIHAGEHDALVAHAVEVWCVKTADGGQGGDSDVPKRSVIPHDVDDVWWSAMLFLQLRESGIEVFVLGIPLLAILCFHDVILGIVDDSIACHIQIPFEERSAKCADE